MNTTTLLRTLKGPPVSVLLALMLPPVQPRGTLELTRITGYSDRPVTQALKLLAELNLAQSHSRYSGWVATAYVRQLFLGESEQIRLPPSSSSSNEQLPFLPEPELPTTTTTTPESYQVRLPPEWRAIADDLTQRCATPPARAQTAATACQQRGDDPDHTRWNLLRWLSYCTSDDGAGLNNVGAYIATRLEQGIPCPDWHRPQMGSPLAHEIRRLGWKLWPEN